MLSFIKKLFGVKEASLPEANNDLDQEQPEKTQELTEFDVVVKTLFEQHLSAYSAVDRHNHHIRQRVSREIVFSQLLRSNGFSISEDKKERLYNTLVEASNIDYQELHAIFLLEDFKWGIFDNCREHCDEYQIYPYAYKFLENKPTLPTNLESALLFVRVAQLRAMLKEKLSQKIPTRKEEVYLLFAQHFTLEDMKEILEERLVEVTEQFERSVKWQKISILGQWFHYYSSNLFDYYLYRIVHKPLVKPKLDISESMFIEDLEFIKKAELSCFDENGNLTSIPPLFPGDYSRINYGNYY